MNQTGGLMRKDGSGVRGGVSRPPVSRDEEFPYDSPLVYGQPNTPGKHTGRVATGPVSPPMPKDLTDDAWEQIGEAIGVPFDIGMSSRGTRTSTVPGGPPVSPGEVDPSGSAWAVSPAGDRVFGRGTSSKMTQRGAFSEAWVSLKNLDAVPMGDSLPLEDEILSSLRSEFGDAVSRLEKIASGFSAAERILMLFDLDPEHAANELADVGDERIDAIYRSWRDPVLPPDGDEEEYRDED